MDDHQLKTLLQLQLATDSSSVIHLPYILQTLSPQSFSPSSGHSHKWTTRIYSLIHSKDSGARWAGLSIALRTSMFSKTLMMECAQSWVGVALPMLSKNETSACLKACIRLVRYIFSNAVDVPEFQRQVVTPNITKFSQALHSLAGRGEDEELTILCLSTLSYLIPIYPSPHRALHPSLSTLSLKFLNGSSPRPSSKALVQAASQLYSVLPVTGGKVGASNLWRKSVDESLSFTRDAYASLTSTFPQESPANPSQTVQNSRDPVIYIPLNLDRLRCGIIVLCHLLSVDMPRSVQLPVGPFIKLCIALLSCNGDEQAVGYIDATARILELSVVPAIVSLGCDLLACLAKCVQFHLTAHVTRLLSCVTYQLEKLHVPKLPLLGIIPILLTRCHPLANPIIPNRLVKAVLPSLTSLLSSESDIRPQEEQNGTGRKKGKKRARGYEGDEVFRTTKDVGCQSAEAEDAVVTAVHATQVLLRDPGIAPAVQSLASRVLLSLYVSLPRLSPASLSHNISFHGPLCAKVQEVCIELSSGNASVMSRSLPLVASLHLGDNSERTTKASGDVQRRLDLLLHPRLPPLVRPMPPVEVLSLFRAEEPQDEADLRKELGVDCIGESRSDPMDVRSSEPGYSEMDIVSTPRQNERNQTLDHNSPSNQSSMERPPDPLPRTQSPSSLQTSMPNLQRGPEQSGQVVVPASRPIEDASTVDSFQPKSALVTKSPRPSTQSGTIALTHLDDDEEDIPSINMDSDSD